MTYTNSNPAIDACVATDYQHLLRPETMTAKEYEYDRRCAAERIRQREIQARRAAFKVVP